MVILESSRTRFSGIVSCVRAGSQELQSSPASTLRSQPSRPLADSIHSFRLQHDSGSYCLCGKGIFVRNTILLVLQEWSWSSGNGAGNFIWRAELLQDKSVDSGASLPLLRCWEHPVSHWSNKTRAVLILYPNPLSHWDPPAPSGFWRTPEILLWSEKTPRWEGAFRSGGCFLCGLQMTLSDLVCRCLGPL